MTSIKGFDQYKFPARRSFAITLQGLDGTGKSSLALSAPGDIAYLFTERSADHLKINGVPVVDMPNVHPFEIPYSFGYRKTIDLVEGVRINDAYKEQLTVDELNEQILAWEYFQSLYSASLDWEQCADPFVVIDSMSTVYKSARLAINGRLEKVRGRDYGPVNESMEQLVYEAAKASGKTVIFLNRLKEKWVNDTNTGMHVIDGYSQTRFASHVVVECRYDYKTKTYAQVIDKCVDDATLNGEQLYMGDTYAPHPTHGGDIAGLLTMLGVDVEDTGVGDA